MGTVCHKVIGPNVVQMRRPESDARSIIEPQTTPLRLLLGNFETLLPPDPLHPLVVDSETLPV